ncbi:uncharacterized protein LOC134653223 [Cydia amplana]|uniref:uncharacterized protein LOC134653223 n=1 Tax=Cydia amplana TaxID=1869771 RepID=UPI002FE67F78
MKWCQTKCPTIPIVRKCCFFVPIRKGVIIFGYVNLVLTLLVFPFFVFMLVEEATKDGDGEELPPRMDPIVHIPLTLAFLLTDVIMYIVLLIGAHKRNQNLLKSYLYFGLVFQLVTFCVDMVFLDMEEYLENAVYFFFLGLNVYLLFLVYNTVRVIEESAVQYVAHQDLRHLIM